MPNYLVFLLLFLGFFTTSNASIECNGKIIEHCIECNSLENSNLCSKCEDKYFLFYEKNSCIPCNDTKFGQEGCKGNCNGSDYEKNGFAICEKDGCKDGYYNFDGLCKKCSTYSQGCKKCSFDSPENKTEKEFKCNECESNEYLLTESGKCEKCMIYLCDKCHYNGNKAECDKCQDNCYKNYEGECTRCRIINIEGGKCTSCSDNDADIVEGSCYCNPKYSQDSDSKCHKCSDNCLDCEYDESIKETKCVKCNIGFTLDNKSKCISCEVGCLYCDFNEKENNTICLSCNNGLLFSNNTCPTLLEHCNKNIIIPLSQKGQEEELICINCDNYLPLLGTQIALSPNHECSQCNEDVGYGCKNCQYNNIELKYDCLNCWHNFLVYVNNEFKCYSNRDDNIDLYGCLYANYNSELKKYECLSCDATFLRVIYNNNLLCRDVNSLDLQCYEAENLGTVGNPIYSCNKCSSMYYSLVIVDSVRQIKDCVYRNDNISFCEIGIIDKEGNYKCKKCSENASLNNLSICQCDSDSFNKTNDFCYKCDDEVEGNPGCVSEKGCKFIKDLALQDLKCNECKEGYYKDENSNCQPCNLEIGNCGNCYLDEKEEELICNNCSSNYIWDEERNKCVLNECEEYPEIAQGCIICKDKLDEYKINNKCQTCKYGYFKTKNESCIYCRSEEYGGPGCYECGYEKDENGSETDKIICINCFSMNYFDVINYDYHNKYFYFDQYRYEYFFDSLLSSDKKCYIARYDLFEPCLKYDFIKDKNNNKKLSCIICARGYYLDSNGKCISFINKIEFIPNCENHIIYIGGYGFNYYPYNKNDKITYYKDMDDYFKSFPIFNEYIRDAKDIFKSDCLKCQDNYYLNNQEKCESITVEKCTGRFIIQNSYEREKICKQLCNENNYLPIYLKLKNGRIDFDFENFNSSSNDYNIKENFQTILKILDDFNIINEKETKTFILDNPICYILSDEKLKDKYEGCKSLVYIPKTKSFQCIECNEDYILDDKNHFCNKDYSSILSYCISENIGNKTHPIYSCKSCKYDDEILVTYENGVKDCKIYMNIIENYAFSFCKEAIASSKYFEINFNCTICANNYTPVYSEKYNQILCALNSSKEIDGEEKNFDFRDEPSTGVKDDGTCEYGSFSPDGKKCYNCNSSLFRNPGCKGNCIFKPKSNPSVLCESECESGYFESKKGVCEPCEYIYNYCDECDYKENFYPINYVGVNKSRTLVCNKCKEGYLLTKEGKCTTCSNLFYNCKKCVINETTSDYDCIECSNKNHGLDKYGDCTECTLTNFILNGKCIECGNVDKGGIANCRICQGNLGKNGTNGAICKQCNEEFILLTDNNTCLYRENNTDLAQFNSCFELKLENSKLTCSRCKPLYSLLKTENNHSICTYTPSLYDANYIKPYFYKYYFGKYSNNYLSFLFFVKNDNNYKQAFRFPCKESINLGTKENPKYSCVKCYDAFEDEELDKEYYNYIDKFYDVNHYDSIFDFAFDYHYEKHNRNDKVKINDLTKNNISYCIHGVEFTEYCSEATYNIFNGTEIYNCSKCINNYYLTKNETSNIYYCSDNQSDIPDSSSIQAIEPSNNPSISIIETELSSISYSFNNETKENDIQNASDKPAKEQTDLIEPDITNKCLVDKCRNCISGNNFYCQNCISSDYEVNKISGSCVKKIKSPPSITLKDIFGLNMNMTKKRNGRNVSGPSLFLRGITSSQVPQNHAIIMILVFKLISSENSEEQTVKVPAICQTNNNLEETDNSTNIVDYECLSDTLVENKYQLNDIEEGEGNDGIVLLSNLDYINGLIQIQKDNLTSKINSEYTTKDLPSVFKIENNSFNYYASNKIFNIVLNGEMVIDKGIPKGCNKVLVTITKINDEPESSFCIDSNKKGTFNFILEIKKETEDLIIQFKSNIIKISKNRIRYLDNDNDNYEINIPGLEKFNLIYNQTTISKEEKYSHNNKRESNSNNGWKIALGVIAGVVALVAVVIAVLCLKKIGKKNNKYINETSTEQNINNSNMN